MTNNNHLKKLDTTNGLVIIPFGFPWDWVCDFEKQTALQLAKKNIVIAFFPFYGITLKMWGLSKSLRFTYRASRNIIVFKPLYIIPFPTIPLLHWLNQYIALIELKIWIKNHYDDKKKILWMFPYQLFPKPDSYGNDFLKVYDCIDFLPPEHQKDELSVVKQSDVIFTNSSVLYKQKKRFHPNIYSVPLGFDDGSFTKNSIRQNIFRFRNIPKPWIVYAGNINERLDYNFLEIVIKNLPSASFLFIGPLVEGKYSKQVKLSFKTLLAHPNVYHVGKIPRNQLGFVYKNARVGLIPYDTSSLFNKYSYPMKIMEYFLHGLAVVATKIDELQKFKSYIDIVETPEEAVQKIRVRLKRGVSNKYKKWAHRIAMENTWEKKVHAEMKILASQFKYTNFGWKKMATVEGIRSKL